MPRRVHILIGSHLSTAPRARKEARALAAAGWTVEVSGVWFDEALAELDRRLMTEEEIAFSPALDFRPRQAGRHAVRAGARLARELYRATGRFSPALLGYGARALLGAAETARAGLTIVHSEAGLWAGAELLRQGRRVGVDFEDWFSRDLPAEARHQRPVRKIAALERTLAREAVYRLAPSHALARALGEACDASPPTVVYNAFPPEPNAPSVTHHRDRRDKTVPSLHWYSQTLGPGRGLELLFSALPRLRYPVEVHLRGAATPEARDWLERQRSASWPGRLTLHPPVTPAELPGCIAEHDIGLALETASIPSRDLTVTNKVFQYLEAGLAVVATPTRGQREVLERCAGAATILPEESPAALAHALNGYLIVPARLARARAAARPAVAGYFGWEVQSVRLQEEAERAWARPAKLPVLSRV